MGKGLLNKLKNEFLVLGLASGLSFGTIKAQSNLINQATNENTYELHKQKQDSLYRNYSKIEEVIQERYKQKKDSIFDIYQNYYKKKIGVEDPSLIFFLPDSLLNSFRKELDSLDNIFDPKKKSIYNNYKQKKDSISICYNQKVYGDDYNPKEDSLLKNILEDFLGKYRIETVYFEKIHLDGSFTNDSIVYKTPINYLDPFDYEKEKGPDQISAWKDRELAGWLSGLGESKRNSLKKSILEKEEEITYGYLWNLRRRLDKNYPKKPVRVPGTDTYYIPMPQKLKGGTISKNALFIFDTIDSTTQKNYKKNIKFKKNKDAVAVLDKDKKNIKYKFIDK